MRRWLVIASLLPCFAFAEWRQLGTVAGTPSDIVVIDGGLVVTASSGPNGTATAWLALSDGGVEQLASLNSATGYVGAGFDGTCLSALTPTSSLEFSCGTPVSIGVNSSGAYRSIGTRGVAVTFNGSVAQFASAPIQNTTWSPQPPTFTQQAAARGLGFANIDGIDFATTAATGVPGIRVSVDGGAPFSIVGSPTSVDVVPFALNGEPAVLAVTNTGTLALVPNVNGVVIETSNIPSGLTLRRVASSMASTTTGVALSPIPDPSNVAMNWVARTNGPALDGRVHCLNSRWCAALSSSGAVWLYENSHAPQFSLVSNLMTPGVPTRFTVDAGDDDGDPVFITWTTPDGGALTGAEVDITFPATSCTGALEVNVRDALFSTTQQLNVMSESRGTAELTGPTSAIAGGVPVTFTAAIDGGCVSANFRWTTSDGSTGAGSQFEFTPPVTSCTPGADVVITANVNWSSGSPTQLTSVVTIEPWGAPETPVFAMNAVQDGGTSVVWSPLNPDHVCTGNSGFPGTTLIWEFVDGGTVVDGGLLIDASSSCEAARVVASAYREVVGEQFGRRSDAGTLIVDVLPSRDPLDANTQFTMTATAGAGVAEGTTSLTASCLEQRTVDARISVLEGASEIASNTFTTPGPWSLAIPGGCAGGTYEVVAQLFEDNQPTGAESRQSITTSETPVEVGQLDVAEARVECGSAVTTNITLLPVDGSCASTEVTWRTPAASGVGREVPLQLEGLDAVGQNVELEFTVSGGNNMKTETRLVKVVTRPFVGVAIRSEPLLAQQEEGRTYVVSLINRTGCDVRGLTVTLTGQRLSLDSLHDVELAAYEVKELRVRQGPSFGGMAVTVSMNDFVVSENLRVVATPECGCSGTGGGLTMLSLLAVSLLRRRKQAMTRS